MTQKPTEFIDFITKKRYQAPPSQLKQFQLYRSRYVVGLCMGVLLYQIKVNPILAITISVAFIVISEFRFRTYFLKQCKSLSVKPEQPKELRSIAIVMNFILYMLLAGSLVFYALFTEHVDNPILLYIIAGCSFIISLAYGYKYLSAPKK